MNPPRGPGSELAQTLSIRPPRYSTVGSDRRAAPALQSCPNAVWSPVGRQTTTQFQATATQTSPQARRAHDSAATAFRNLPEQPRLPPSHSAKPSTRCPQAPVEDNLVPALDRDDFLFPQTARLRSESRRQG